MTGAVYPPFQSNRTGGIKMNPDKKQKVHLVATILLFVYCLISLPSTVGNIYTVLERGKRAQTHLKLYENDNCNKCHLGESFIALFDHPALKKNQRIREYAIIRAKLKPY